MKYKNLKSFAHNFTHSFVSYENRVDCEYVIEELLQHARELKGEKLSIYWLPDKSPKYNNFSRLALESIDRYKNWLHQLASQHEIDLSTIKEFRTDIYRKQNHQIEVLSSLTDDKGKIYEQFIL